MPWRRRAHHSWETGEGTGPIPYDALETELPDRVPVVMAIRGWPGFKIFAAPRPLASRLLPSARSWGEAIAENLEPYGLTFWKDEEGRAHTCYIDDEARDAARAARREFYAGAELAESLAARRDPPDDI